MPRFKGAWLSVLAALALLGGCGQDAAPPATAGSSPPSASYPVTVGTVTLDARPEKIVSLAPTVTEMLFAIGAGPQVTAVDDQSNYPAEAPRSGLSGFQPNAEAIAAEEPDLVVLSDDINKIVEQLTQLKIPVYLAEAAVTLDDTYREITDLGALTGHADQAEAVVRSMQDDIAKLAASLPQRAERLSYYYELSPDLYTATSKTFIGALFADLGLTNVADPADAGGTDGGYPQLSGEFLIKADPDLIFLADSKCCQQSASTVAVRPGWSGLTAVAGGRVVALDDDIASRWGPRVVDLIRTIVDTVAKVPA